MSAIPLITHETPEAIVAWRGAAPVTARRFILEVRRLADRLPAGRHVLNVCADRYRFTLGLAACLLTQRVSLLPSTHTPEVIRHLAEFAPDAFCLTDDPRCEIALPQWQFPAELAGEEVPHQVPRLDPDQAAAIVFTSGSTGTPLPFRKTWGRLARCVQAGAPRLGLADGRSHTLVGTVPPQHMYGFESTVLLALQSGNALASGRPFYPADICSALSLVPRPRTLISTPIHLRALLAADIPLPPVDRIVSATAPLDRQVALEVETRFGAPLIEIYGSTETGQIATRETARTDLWELWPEVSLSAGDGRTYAHGGHVEQITPMCDVIEIIDDRSFRLHGRSADLVNIAGKRSSFGYLNHQLNSIPGVLDGVFFLPEEAGAGATGVARLAALVVAPTLTAVELAEQLRRRIDPVFMPRPLLFVERLPRNATGKLPQQALRTLAESRLKSVGSS